MKLIRSITLIFTVLTISALCHAYDAVFSETFTDTTTATSRWGSTNYVFTDGCNGQGVLIQTATPGKTISANVPVSSLQGARVFISGNVKAENVSAKPHSWNGIKLMLVVTDGSGYSVYPQATIDVGTFTWVNKGFTITLSTSAQSAHFTLGLEGVTGKVWFDDIKIELIRSYRPFPPARSSSIPINKGHLLGALRGAMVTTTITPESLRIFGEEWNANLIRWQLGGTTYDSGLLTTNYDAVLGSETAKLDSSLPWCKRYRLMVLIDLHSLSKNQFTSVAAQDKLVDVWKQLATKYKGNPAVWGYDIANEPVETITQWQDGLLLWEELAEKVARAIREIDPVKPIIVEPANGGGPSGMTNFRPLDFSIPNIVYSVHMYQPHAITHQLVSGLYPGSYVYPSTCTINGVMWDRAQLVSTLQPAIDFQEKYRVPIYIGEFSCIRWAPDNSALRYLQDCISVFEEHGWDWSYHAFREFSGWSVEYSEDKNDLIPTATPNARQNLLRFWYASNKKPFATPATPKHLRLRQ